MFYNFLRKKLFNYNCGRANEPIRTLHHFACTGGTLFSRCLAAMPNTMILSEIDPLSLMVANPKKPVFSPTDLILQLRQSSVGCSDELVVKLFNAQIDIIARDAAARSLIMVLRDHTHSHFCVGNEILNRPTVKQLVESKFKIFSLVTVRDPVDSYLSLMDNGWIGFSPNTFDEYCGRYIKFLNAYAGVSIIKYEELVERPRETMRHICNILKINYSDLFLNNISEHRISGDSGRRGDVIGIRPRKVMSDELCKEIKKSKNYLLLVDRLEYLPIK
jgi:hypothetical protein